MIRCSGTGVQELYEDSEVGEAGRRSHHTATVFIPFRHCK
jgi:hypothetical protein